MSNDHPCHLRCSYLPAETHGPSCRRRLDPVGWYPVSQARSCAASARRRVKRTRFGTSALRANHCGGSRRAVCEPAVPHPARSIARGVPRRPRFLCAKAPAPVACQAPASFLLPVGTWVGLLRGRLGSRQAAADEAVASAPSRLGRSGCLADQLRCRRRRRRPPSRSTADWPSDDQCQAITNSALPTFD
jgi:hypothetical protein